jgi:hypothetical protein
MRFVAFVAIVAAASVAGAIPFQPLKAKLAKVSMVVAYDQCVAPAPDHRPPVTSSCTSPVASTANNGANVTTFGPDGQLLVQLKTAKGDLKVVAKGKDIVNNGSSYTGSLNLAVMLRMTDDANVGPSFTAPGTVVDFGFTVPIGCVAGVCKASTTFNALAVGLFAEGEAANVEIVRLQVEDPDGEVAFRPGLFVP